MRNDTIRKLRIAFDTNALDDFSGRGIGNYMYRFCMNIIERYSENEYLFWGESRSLVLFKEYDTICEEYNRDDYTSEISRLIEEYKPDIYIDFSPVWGKEHSIRDVKSGNTMMCCIVHDIIPYVMKKEYYLGNRTEYSKYIKRMENLKLYDALFANSRNTADDIIKVLEIRKEKIQIIYAAAGRNAIRRSDHYTEFKDYWLYPAGNAPQKNIIRVVMAYIRASAKRVLPHLVVMGEIGNSYLSRIKRLASVHGLQEKVLCTGFIEDAKIDEVYYGAKWVLFPSLYEGFGMPIIEAWEHELPVLTSNNSSMIEIADGAAVLVDPYDVDSIIDGLMFINDISEDDRNAFIAKGKKRCEYFSWDKTIDCFMKYIKGNKNIESIKLQKGIEDNSHKTSKLDYGFSADFDMMLNVDAAERETRSFALMNKWMYAIGRGYTLHDYFVRHKIKKIAIYGIGILADLFIMQMQYVDVKIVYGIDTKPWHIEDDFKVYGLEEEYPDVDMLVATIIVDGGKFRERWGKIVDFKIVTIEEIVKKMYEKECYYEC